MNLVVLHHQDGHKDQQVLCSFVYSGAICQRLLVQLHAPALPGSCLEMIRRIPDLESAAQQLKIPQSDKPLTSSQMRQRCRPAVPNVEVGFANTGVNYKRSNNDTPTARTGDSLRY